MRSALWAIGIGLLLDARTVRAEEAVSVWYRTSEGCPDGAAFVARLHELGTRARLASVGDRVDFVVTLGGDSSESSGRLERQTRGGTVAIREYRDARCEQVAEALALTLELALEPTSGGADAPALQPTVSTIAATSGTASPTAPDVPAASKLASHEAARSALELGAQVALTSGLAPGVLPGGAVFVQLSPRSGWLDSVRASAVVAYGERHGRERSFQVLRAAARVGACVAAWSPSRLSLGPCLAGEAGVLRGAGAGALGASDVGAWGAALAHMRAALRAGSELSFELQAGALLPLVRYALGTRDQGADWYRTGSVGLDVAGGVVWQIP